MDDGLKKQIEARLAAEGLGSPEASAEPEPVTLSDNKIVTCAMSRRAGDAIVFIARNRGGYLYVHRWGSWLKWQKHYWVEDLNDESVLTAIETVVDEYRRVAGAIRQRIEENPNMSAETRKALEGEIDIMTKKINELRDKRRRDVLEFVHTGRDKSMAISGDELDQQPWLLACASGVIELKTGECRPGRQRDYLTCASPTEWLGLEAQCPNFEKFMLSILGEDQAMVDYMQRMLGHALIGRQREHVFLVLSGAKGRNGKDTLMKILSKTLGRDIIAPVPAEMLLDQNFSKSAAGPSPDIMSLRGRRIAYASETDEGRRFSASKVKLLSGGGELVARGLHDLHMSYWESTHTLILLTNDLPHAKADDQAFWSRIHLVPFRYSFLPKPNPNNEFEKQADPDLLEKLAAEASGILAWLVRGCLKYQEIGLCPPEAVTSATQAYRDSEDLVGRFIAECCEVKDGVEIQASEFYDAFTWWFNQEIAKKREFSPKKFGEILDKKGYSKKKKSVNFWQGIHLSDEFRAARLKAEDGEKRESGGNDTGSLY